MDDGNVIDLSKKRACNQCGHEAGGHFEECPRSSENMRRLVERRKEMIASGELVPTGGRKKKIRMTRAELDEYAKKSAGEMLYGDRAEAVALLRKQMSSKDERVAQRAALEILAYTDGKPTQKIEQTTDQVTVVEYRSAALAFEQFQPEAATDAVG